MEKFSRRDFIKVAGVIAGSLAMAACSQETVETPYETPTDLPTKIPTDKPQQKDTLTPTNTSDVPLQFGEYDMKVTPFSIKPTPETEKFLGYIPGGFPETYADIPLPFGMENFGTDNQTDLQEQQNEQFEKAAKKHPKNPYYVVYSDVPKIGIFNFHSVQETASGEVARIVGAYAYNHPEKIDQLYGNKFVVTLNGITPVEAEIVHATTITKEFFDDLTETGPWRIDEATGSLFGLTGKFNIPNTIRHDTTPGVHYMTFIGCQNIKPGQISLRLSQNIANRSLVTLKIKL